MDEKKSNNITEKGNYDNYYHEYEEIKIGRTLYRVTSVYLGKFKLEDALQDLVVRKVLREINGQT